MQDFALLTALLAWSLLFARLIGARATVGARSMLAMLTLGAAIGPTILMPLHRLIDPMGTTLSLWVEAPRALVTVVVLALPAMVILARRGTHRIASVSDAFLLAFCTGLGFELAGTALAISRGIVGGWDPSLQALTLLPPWNYEIGTAGHLGGAGYRVGLVVTGYFGMLRFARSRPAAIVTGLLLLAVVVADASLWASTMVIVPTGLLASLLANGHLVPWLTVAAALAAALAEDRWVGGPRFAFLAEWRALAPLVGTFNWRAARDASRRDALARQEAIATRELGLRSDASLQRARDVLHAARTVTRAAPAAPDRIVATAPGWLAPVLPWAALAVLLFIEPRALHVLNLALAALVIVRVLALPHDRRAIRTLDGVVGRGVARFMAPGALVAAWMVLASATPVYLFPWTANQAAAVGFGLPSLVGVVDAAEQDRVNLLLMLLVTGTLFGLRHQSLSWTALWHPANRRVTVRRIATVLLLLAGGTAALRVYAWGIPKIHERYGERMFAVASEQFGRGADFGNNFAVWAMTLAVAAGGLVVWALMRLLVRRAVPAVVRAIRPPSTS